MTSALIIERGTHIAERAGSGAAAPSLYDAKQFYENGIWVGAGGAGSTFAIPAGLPIGWRARFGADPSTTNAVSVSFDASYTVVGSAALGAAPFTIPAGCVLNVEMIDTNRFLAWLSGGGAGTITPVADRTALSVLSPAARYDGALAMVLTDGSLWRFSAASTLAADYTGTVAIPAGAVTAANLVIVPAAGTGRWLRADKAFTARIPFVQATANAAVLWTPPTGVVVRMTAQPFWNITSFTAGDGARRIGASSSSADAEFTAVGDLLGGTAGQLPVLGITPGVVGDAFLDSDTANTSLATLQKLVFPLGTGTVGLANVRYDIMAAGTDQASGMICIPVSVDMTTAMIS